MGLSVTPTFSPSTCDAGEVLPKLYQGCTTIASLDRRGNQVELSNLTRFSLSQNPEGEMHVVLPVNSFASPKLDCRCSRPDCK